MNNAKSTLGFNSNGETGSSSTSTTTWRDWAKITSITSGTAIDIAASYLITLVLRQDGTVVAFGRNAYGNWGNGGTDTMAASSNPVTASVTNVAAIDTTGDGVVLASE
jgi:alpha-tubulin suppressor-like RCC1 family protein